MHRLKRRTLLLGGLLGLLAGCGQVPGGAGTISGVVSAPAGGDVSGTEVFACYENEPECAMLGDVTITQTGTSAPYQLSGLPTGRYSVYALKELGGEDYAGWYVAPGDEARRPALVTPPTTGIDIEMIAVPDAERSLIPEKLKELSAKTP